MPTSTRDSNSFGFEGTTQRAQVGTFFEPSFAVDTTERDLCIVDSAELGAVNFCMTVKNTGSTTIAIDAYVSNDKNHIASAAGWVNLANVYDEADVSVSLPQNITAGSIEHYIFGYKNQPMLTTFRYWRFTVKTAAGTSTCDMYGNAK